MTMLAVGLGIAVLATGAAWAASGSVGHPAVVAASVRPAASPCACSGQTPPSI